MVDTSRLSFVPRLGAPILFTAPHGIWLHRDGHDDHKPEDYTSYLAKDFAAVNNFSVATWSPEVIAKSKARGAPDPANRDANYAHPDEIATDPWNITLVVRSELMLCAAVTKLHALAGPSATLRTVRPCGRARWAA